MKRILTGDDNNFEPAFVADLVEGFLAAKRFQTHVEEGVEGSIMVLGSSVTSEGKRTILIGVKKVDEGVEVDFKSGEMERKLFKSGSLMSLLGAGALLVRYSRKLDFYERIESELWRHLNGKL